MKYEISRQIIHLTGFIFILLAHVTGKFTMSLIFFLIALLFFIYSEFVRKDHGFSGAMGWIEGKMRELISKLDRQAKRPFLGAFWFYFGLGLTFLIFPIEIATTAGLILAVGDSLSTLVGVMYGRFKMIGNKTLEGSVVFFLVSFLVAIFSLGIMFDGVDAKPFIAFIAFIGSISATFLELIPETSFVRKWERKEIVDDNWIIPLISGLIIYIACIIVGCI